MKKLLLALLFSIIPLNSLADGPIQNFNVMGVADVQSALGSATANLSGSSACASSLSFASGYSYSLLTTGAFVYDTTTPAHIVSGTTIVGLPGSCPSGQIQLSVNAGGTATGDTLTFGGQPSQIIGASKVWVPTNGINSTLDQAISNGTIGGGSGSGSGIELLSNPGFEAGGFSNGWSVTGGTAANVTSGSNLMFGKTTASFLASASGQKFESAAIAIQGLAGGNCAASMYYLYSGASGDYSLRAFDGTNVLNTIALPPNSNPSAPVTITFACGSPASATLQFQVVSNVSSPSTIYMDNTHLGSLGSFQVSQSYYFGGVVVPSGCNMTLTGTIGSPTQLVGTGCTGATLVGGISSFNANAGITFTGPAGEYDVRYSGYADNPNGASAGFTLYLTDGTTVGYGTTSGTSNGQQHFMPSEMTAPFIYTSSGTHTINMTGQGGATSEPFGYAFVGGALSISIIYHPASTQTIQNITTNNWLIDAGEPTASGNNLGTSSQASFTSINDNGFAFQINPGNHGITPNVPCSGGNPATGLTCSSGNQEAGVSAYIPAAGLVQACVDYNLNFGSSAAPNMQDIFEVVTTADASDVAVLGGTTTQNVFLGIPSGTTSQIQPSGHVCELVNIPSIGITDFKLFYKSSLSSVAQNQVFNIHWIIKPITQNVTTPVLINSVTSDLPGVKRTNDLTVASTCSSDPCTITTQDGSWATAVNHTGTGSYTVHFTSGVFSGPPTCRGDSNQGPLFTSGSLPTTSLWNFETINTSSVAADSAFMITCSGPH